MAWLRSSKFLERVLDGGEIALALASLKFLEGMSFRALLQFHGFALGSLVADLADLREVPDG
jgi:hypothetical protein